MLSRLEQKVQSSSATETDYFLWALKIRFLLSLKDTTIQLDRTNPSKGKLMKSEAALIGQDFVKHTLNNFERTNFVFRPNPFGTVLLFDNHIKDGEFGFADIPHPYWGLTISLPNNKILSVLFSDRGLVKKEILKDYKTKGGLKTTVKNCLLRQPMS